MADYGCRSSLANLYGVNFTDRVIGNGGCWEKEQMRQCVLKCSKWEERWYLGCLFAAFKIKKSQILTRGVAKAIFLSNKINSIAKQ